MNIPTPNEFAKQGGYNPFPPRWERWLNAMREGILSAQPVAGKHVTTDEHPGKGTVINVERRPGAPVTPPGTCSGAVTITVQFSGVTLCTGCLDATPFGFGYSMNNLTATGTINDTFTLTSFGSPLCDGAIGWFYSSSNRLNYDIYSTGGCSGTPSNQNDLLVVYAKCLTGVMKLWLLTGGNQACLFYATGITTLTGIANTVTCATTVPDPNDACFPGTNDFVIAHGGSATITL